jgi:hypothetical protein
MSRVVAEKSPSDRTDPQIAQISQIRAKGKTRWTFLICEILEICGFF